MYNLYKQIYPATQDGKNDRWGVPQGTVMGPLLFLLYINDIGVQVKTYKICMFADDALLYHKDD